MPVTRLMKQALIFPRTATTNGSQAKLNCTFENGPPTSLESIETQ